MNQNSYDKRGHDEAYTIILSSRVICVTGGLFCCVNRGHKALELDIIAENDSGEA